MIDAENYPQLKLFLLNRNEQHQIEEFEAFCLYERNWRFVEVDKLTDAERMLITRLSKEYGNETLKVS